MGWRIEGESRSIQNQPVISLSYRITAVANYYRILWMTVRIVSYHIVSHWSVRDSFQHSYRTSWRSAWAKDNIQLLVLLPLPPQCRITGINFHAPLSTETTPWI